MPLAFMSEEDLDNHTIICSVVMNEQEGYLVDALHQEDLEITFLKNCSFQKDEESKVTFIKEKNLQTKNIFRPILWEWNKAIHPCI